MSNHAAPSANVNAANEKDKNKCEFSDVEEDVKIPTGKLILTNKRGTGANGQKIIHGKTKPSTVAISTRRVSKNDPPKTNATQKEVDPKDTTPQGQDSSGSSTAMSLCTQVFISMLVSIVCSCLVSWILVPQRHHRPPVSKPLPTMKPPTSMTSVTSVSTPTPLPPDPMSDPRIDDLVKEVEHLSQMQTKILASVDALRKEITDTSKQIHANADKTNAFEYSLFSLKDRVDEETELRREKLRLEFEENVSDVTKRTYAVSERIDNLQDEARPFKTDLKALEKENVFFSKKVEGIGEELQSKFENLSNNAEIQESHMKSVIRILTNSDVRPLHIAVALLFMFVLYTWYLIKTINRQHHRVVHSVERTQREHVSRHEGSILERVAVPGRLDNTVCILGFYKSTLELRTRLTQSVLEPGINQTHFLLDSHEDILRLPPCRLFLVFVDNNERHVILEDPSLGLGDLRLTTVRAIEKMRASMVVIYYGDHESRNVGDHLFNIRLTSVQHQSELSALCRRNRFFSTARKFTDRQIHALKNAVAAEIN